MGVFAMARKMLSILLLSVIVLGNQLTSNSVNAATAIAPSSSLSGYATTVSLLPGEALRVAVQSTSNWTAKIQRVGNYDGGFKTVSEVSTQSPASQPPCALSVDAANTLSCNWNINMSVDTSGFQTGLYVIRLESVDGYSWIPFVVRTLNPAGTTLIKVGVLSLQAYNKFGGYNAYKGNDDPAQKSRVVSFDRPLDDAGMGVLDRFEMSVARQVDATLPNASWTTDIDVSTGVTPLAGVRQIVTGGHDEYWTNAERNNVEAAVRAGANLFVTGANSIYWRVRLQDSTTAANRQFAIYKDALLDPLANFGEPTIRFREKPFARSESQLTATQYNNWFDTCGQQPESWIVSDPNWWGYNNTGVVLGSTIPGLVTDEVDQLMKKYKIPKNTRVVAHGNYLCAGGTVKKNHDATFVTFKSGGSVFAPGTRMWSCALVSNCPSQTMTADTYRFAQVVTANVLTVFDKAPVKKSWRAKNNLKKVYPKTKFKTVNW